MSVGAHAQAPSGASGSPVTTGNVTTTSGSTVLLFAVVSAAGGGLFGATPVQDNKGNTWNQIGTDLTYDSSQGLTRCYQAKNITGGAGHNFTCTPDSFSFPALLMQEVTNVSANPTTTVARAQVTHSQATPYVGPNISPANAATIVGNIWTNAPSGTETDTWGGSFASGDKTEEIGNASASITGSQAATDKAAGTYNSSVTVSGVTTTDSADWIVAVETLGGAPSLMGASIWMTS